MKMKEHETVYPNGEYVNSPLGPLLRKLKKEGEKEAASEEEVVAFTLEEEE